MLRGFQEVIGMKRGMSRSSWQDDKSQNTTNIHLLESYSHDAHTFEAHNTYGECSIVSVFVVTDLVVISVGLPSNNHSVPMNTNHFNHLGMQNHSDGVNPRSAWRDLHWTHTVYGVQTDSVSGGEEAGYLQVCTRPPSEPWFTFASLRDLVPGWR